MSSDGSFHIDSSVGAKTNLITHAHFDHIHPGSDEYWCAAPCEPLLRMRLGANVKLRAIPYGEKLRLGDFWISFHPAGHILGSAQIRIERRSRVCVVTSDFKRQADPTCLGYESIPCETLVLESTYGLPIYHWPPAPDIIDEIYQWWSWCRKEQLTALLYCSSMGKAQRLLAELYAYTDQKVYLHGALLRCTELYRKSSVQMLPTEPVVEAHGNLTGSLVLAPPSAHRSPWVRRFPAFATALASGRMHVQRTRRQEGYQNGFALSDHADWQALLQTVRESGAREVYVTHRHADCMARYLREVSRLEAYAVRSEFGLRDFED